MNKFLKRPKYVQFVTRFVVFAVASLVLAQDSALAQVPPVRYITANKTTIPDQSAPFVIDYSTKEYDAGNRVKTGSDWHYVVPVDGIYHVAASAHISNTENAIAILGVLVNGKLAATLGAYQLDKASFGLFPSGGTDLRLKKSDKLSIGLVLHQNGKSATLSGGQEANWVAIHFVRPPA